MVKSAFQTLEKYKHLLKGIQGPHGPCVLEIGSDRFEGSTTFFANICKQRNVPFYSVDCEPQAHERAKSVEGVHAFLKTGEDFIRDVVPDLGIKFSFVFLDNFDFLIKSFKWEWEDHTRNTYKNLGMDLNNENSQKAHLTQAQLIQPYLEPDAIIGFDDTWQKPDGTFDGKGGTAIPWLLRNGYRIIEQGRIGEDVVGGYVILTKMFVPLKIRVFACCKNEEKMLPFFLDYYSQIADEIVIYEGGSTDNSLEVLSRYPKVRVVSTGVNEKLDERELMNIRNNEYKKDADKWDWQIIVDVDEFLYHPTLIQKLQEYSLRGVTLPGVSGYEMLSYTFPEYDAKKSIVDQIQTGIRNDQWQAKRVIFSPKDVTINYIFGCHTANCSGNVVSNECAELMLLHYRWLSYDYFVNKNRYISDRLSEFNKANNFGFHTTINAKMSEDEYNAKVKQAYNVFNLRLNIGCDNGIVPGYVNIDLNNAAADLHVDCRSLPYSDQSATEILSRNMIEHFNFHEAWVVLREWQRVLVEGGKLIIETVDFANLCAEFAKSSEPVRVGLYEKFFSTPWVPGKANYFLYTENQLLWTLQCLKFRNIVRKTANRASNQHLTLRIECVK